MSEAILLKTRTTEPKTINQTSEQAWTPAKVLYAALMTFNLLSFIWLLATGAGITMNPVSWFARLATVPLAICLGKLWKERGFRILAVYTILIFLRVFIANPADIFHREPAENYLSALWLFASCYGMARILNIRQIKKILLVCASFWIAAMTVFACLGIYAAWNGIHIPTAGDGGCFFGLYEGRLFIGYVGTVSGSILGISTLVASILFCCVRNRIGKTVLVIGILPVVLALALTDSRTAYISVPAGIGVMSFSVVFHAIQEKTKARSNWKPWFISMLVMFLVFVLLVFLILQITPIYNHVRQNGALVTIAYAEGEGNTIISTRGFQGNRVLTGRWELWTDVFQYIGKHPISLLLGQSKLRPTSGFNSFYAHCHCIYIQVLLESGIPGLLLLLSFIIYTLIHSIRVIKNPDLPLWIRLLPALPISLWVGDIAESFTWLRSTQCPMSTILMISAGIICAVGQKQKVKPEMLPRA